jgi:hypothetical protein
MRKGIKGKQKVFIYKLFIVIFRIDIEKESAFSWR